MRLGPILLKPIYFALRNRWRSRLDLRTHHGQDFTIGLFSLGLILAVYKGTLWSLHKINADPNLVYMPPAHPLGLIFMLLFAMLILSGVVSAYGTLFQSDDLDLVLASPTSTSQFFFGKLFVVMIHSIWMPLILIVPLLIAFGQSYNAPATYYFVSLLTLIPYFIIPAALSMILATTITRILPGNRTREILCVVFIVLGVAVYYLITLINQVWQNINDAGQFLQMVGMLSMPNTAWLPSNWIASYLQELIRPTPSGAYEYLMLLCCFTVAITSFAYMLVDAAHYVAYSRAKTNRLVKKRDSRAWQQWAEQFVPFLNQHFRALLIKEFKIFSREIAQAIQLLMLVGLCAMYIYNLRIFAAVQSLPEEVRLWYQRLLFVGNFAIGAFVTTAICTRFAYPSLSLEGRSYWILQKSPLTIIEVMRAKFWSWFLPVSIISCILFSSGALALGTRPRIIMTFGFSSFCVSYGIVGAAVGFGAMYANFTWEHASQLAAGFGSLIFMLYSTFLIGVSMIPTWLLLFVHPTQVFGEGSPEVWGYLWVLFNFALMAGINYISSHLVMRRGERRLIAAMS